MSETSSTPIRAGDTVRVTGDRKWAGRDWTVVKVNPATYKLEDETGMILNASHSLVYKPAPGETRLPPRPEGIRAGAVITYPRALGPFQPGTLFVIIKDKYTELHVVPLGGDDDKPSRYFRVGLAAVTVVDLAAMARG